MHKKEILDEVFDNVIDYYQLSYDAIIAAYNRKSDDTPPLNPDEVMEVFQKISNNFQSNMTECCTQFSQDNIKLNSWFLKKISGEKIQAPYPENHSDTRFKNKMWQENLIFNYVRQYNLMCGHYMKEMVNNLENTDETNKKKALFYVQLINDALAPANYPFINPEVVTATIGSKGKNLVQGMNNLVKDLKNNNSTLPISTCDKDAFTVGENIACTKGQVVFQNKLVQLICYQPKKQTYRIPIFIVPPCINKYYILDLQPHNSFIKWLVDNNYQVFCLSWVNPDKEHAECGIEHYIQIGILESLNQIKKITSQKKVNAIGYCIGGTFLTIAAAYLKKQSDNSLNSMTLLAPFIDFTQLGDLEVFVNEKTTKPLIEQVKKRGFLSQNEMQTTFNIMQSNNLIWKNIIHNYLMGGNPHAFDILTWNDDPTRMPAKMYIEYIQNFFQKNLLVKKNKLQILGVDIDISLIDIPCLILGASRDHIVPKESTFLSSLFFKNREFILCEGGHIAGIINPPSKQKYSYYTGNNICSNYKEWTKDATQHTGSWWSYWNEWCSKRSGKVMKSLTEKDISPYIIEPAPGTYVKKT